MLYGKAVRQLWRGVAVRQAGPSRRRGTAKHLESPVNCRAERGRDSDRLFEVRLRRTPSRSNASWQLGSSCHRSIRSNRRLRSSFDRRRGARENPIRPVRMIRTERYSKSDSCESRTPERHDALPRSNSHPIRGHQTQMRCPTVWCPTAWMSRAKAVQALPQYRCSNVAADYFQPPLSQARWEARRSTQWGAQAIQQCSRFESPQAAGRASPHGALLR